MLDDERSGADAPQSLTGRKHRDEPRLALGQSQERSRERDLTLVLVVDDPRRGVGNQALGDARRA